MWLQSRTAAKKRRCRLQSVTFASRLGAVGHGSKTRPKRFWMSVTVIILSMTILALCQVAALTVWFSASAVVPSILREFPLTSTQI